MTTIAMMPTNSCLVQPSRKRKRANKLHVSFCTQPQNIIYTYSQSDYDRSGLIPDMDSQQLKNQFILTLSLNFIQQEKENVAQKPIQFNKSKLDKRPKLSINTSNLGGPLYFTSLTTNHQKQKLIQEEPENNYEEKEVIDILTMENTKRNSLPLVIC